MQSSWGTKLCSKEKTSFHPTSHPSYVRGPRQQGCMVGAFYLMTIFELSPWSATHSVQRCRVNPSLRVSHRTTGMALPFPLFRPQDRVWLPAALSSQRCSPGYSLCLWDRFSKKQVFKNTPPFNWCLLWRRDNKASLCFQFFLQSVQL